MDVPSGLAAFKNWIEDNQALLQLLGTASLVVLAVTVLALPIIVAQLPEDYFTRLQRPTAARARRRPCAWAIVGFVKNLIGVVLIIAGMGMLVLPGQGALTILIGLALTNFPGKYAIERRIASAPAVGKTLNRIRALAGRPPLQLPSASTPA